MFQYETHHIHHMEWFMVVFSSQWGTHVGVLTVDEKTSNSSNHFYRNLGSDDRLQLQLFEGHVEDWLMSRFLLDFYSHWISIIAKYSERSWNLVRSHIPVILGPVPGAGLRHTNKIPPSDFAANKGGYMNHRPEWCFSVLVHMNIHYKFHPLPSFPARFGDMETTVISLAMEGQFRFQVPAIVCFGTTKWGEMGFGEVQV